MCVCVCVCVCMYVYNSPTRLRHPAPNPLMQGSDKY